jgi:hypothetical protein
MQNVLLEKNGATLEWEDVPHDGPPVLVLKTPTKWDKEGNAVEWKRLIGEAILDSAANLEDYHNRLQKAIKAARDAVLATGRVVQKLDPEALEKKGKQ